MLKNTRCYYDLFGTLDNVTSIRAFITIMINVTDEAIASTREELSNSCLESIKDKLVTLAYRFNVLYPIVKNHNNAGMLTDKVMGSNAGIRYSAALSDLIDAIDCHVTLGGLQNQLGLHEWALEIKAGIKLPIPQSDAALALTRYRPSEPQRACTILTLRPRAQNARL